MIDKCPPLSELSHFRFVSFHLRITISLCTCWNDSDLV